MTSGTDARPLQPGYWYDLDDGMTSRAVDVLEALRRFRRADRDMRHRTQGDMDMGETDLAALRVLIVAEKEGRAIGPTALSRSLEITTAATAKLLARLVESGHITRDAHPTDRRAQVLRATDAAHSEVRATLGKMHQRMIDVVESFDAAEQTAIARFLDSMSSAVSFRDDA